MKNEVIVRSENCLNCGTKLDETYNFCPSCGQKNHTHKLKVGHIIKDFFEDYFSFDSKLVRSILPLLVKPGYLTTEFCSGKRIKYVHPIRLYLFISFVSFFLLALNHEGGEHDNINIGNNELGISFEANGETIKYQSTDHLRRAVEYSGVDNYLDSLGVENKFEKLMITQIYRMSKSDSRSVGQYFSKNASIMMFFLMPIFALLLMLFFRKSGYYYVEHLMHSIHIHSFIFLFFSLFSIVSFFAQVDYAVLIGMLMITVYTIKSLQKVYETTAGKTIANFIGLITLYNIMLVIGLLMTLLLSLALF